MKEDKNKIFIRTFGCQMNTRDSEFIAGLFLEKGYRLVDLPDEADIILFNTCSVREHAEERAISNMGMLIRARGEGRRTKVFGIVGCMAQAKGKELFKRLPGLDLVCGTGEIAKLPELVKKANESRVLALDDIDKPLPELAPDYRESRRHAYVCIMKGCDNFCSYCVVPHVRGKERSRNVEDIVGEIKNLIGRGICDITLLGQNVNSYRGVASPRLVGARNDGGDDKTCNFVQLLRIINGIEGLKRISFLTNHPKDTTTELFEAMRDCEKVVKHLHLPLQSGSDRILGLMNRGYKGADYLNLAAKARGAIPNIRLTTDIIVGFPTETDRDFRDTVNLMQKLRFDLAYIFKYSPRPGTKASFMEDDVPGEAKKIRHKILLDLQREIASPRRSRGEAGRSNDR